MTQLREVDPKTARQWLESGQATLIDVREPDEHARERIRGSHLNALSRFNPSSLPSGRVVLHCKGGKRSAEACRLAAACDVYSLTGGIESWKAAGLPVERSGGGCAVSVLRQMQLTVGTAVLAGTALGFWASPWFFIVPAFFGSGLIFAGASGTCALMSVLSLMPWNRAAVPGGGTCG